MTHHTDDSLNDDVLLPHGRQQLADAIRRNAASRTRRLPSRRIATVTMLGVLATGTAVAATTPWSPDLGGPNDRPTVGTTSIPSDQLDALAVLRREQNDSDRSAPVQTALHQMSKLTHVGVHTDGVRLLASGPDGAAVLVPVEQSGTADADPGHVTPVTKDALCLKRTITDNTAPTPHPSGGETCGTAEDLHAGRIRFVADGLVPDGVARVRVKLTTGAVLTADVTNNYYKFPIDLEASGGSDPRYAAATQRFRTINGRPIEWLDQHGAPVPKTAR